jgi:hypothetical protein
MAPPRTDSPPVGAERSRISWASTTDTDAGASSAFSDWRDAMVTAGLSTVTFSAIRISSCTF